LIDPRPWFPAWNPPPWCWPAPTAGSEGLRAGRPPCPAPDLRSARRPASASPPRWPRAGDAPDGSSKLLWAGFFFRGCDSERDSFFRGSCLPPVTVATAAGACVGAYVAGRGTLTGDGDSAARTPTWK